MLRSSVIGCHELKSLPVADVHSLRVGPWVSAAQATANREIVGKREEHNPSGFGTEKILARLRAVKGKILMDANNFLAYKM